MPEAVTVVETVAETAVETAPVAVSAGLLDPKKVAIAAAATVAVAGCGYICYRLIKKRKAEKTVEVNPVEEVIEIVEVEEEPPKEKTKAKK